MREAWNKGIKMPKEFCDKISKSLIGNKNRWKGDDASYAAKHMWIIKHYGKANKCENMDCNFDNPLRYEWANLSGEYRREREDYIMLCPSCHRKKDLKKEFCPHGHKLTKDNLYINYRGHRLCVVCTKESQKRYRENAKNNKIQGMG